MNYYMLKLKRIKIFNGITDESLPIFQYLLSINYIQFNIYFLMLNVLLKDVSALPVENIMSLSVNFLFFGDLEPDFPPYNFKSSWFEFIFAFWIPIFPIGICEWFWMFQVIAPVVGSIVDCSIILKGNLNDLC